VVNKLINDRKIYDKCVKITDGSFFNARILFGLSLTDILYIDGVKEGITWKDAIDQLYRDYELIPCQWGSFDSLLDLEAAIEEEHYFDSMMDSMMDMCDG
jgi:hypothetical protein